MRIKFIVDSASDIPKDYALKHDISVIGLPIYFADGTQVRAWHDITPKEFYERLETESKIPTTSQAPLPEIKELLLDGALNYDATIYFTLSSKASGTYQTCHMLKNEILEEYPDAKIEIVDSMRYSLFIVLMLDEAIRLNNEGKSLKEIIEGAKDVRRHTNVYVLVDTLKYLEKGGRINKASLIAGSLLNIKPVLSVINGIMESVDKFRGSKTVIPKLVQKVIGDDLDTENPHFCIVHANADERADQLWATVKELCGEDSVLEFKSDIGASIGTHIGPGTLALFYRTKSPRKIYEED